MQSGRARWDRLVELAGRQEDVAATHQIHELGFSLEELRGMVRAGFLHRVHRGVYVVGRRRPRQRGWLFAALLACGPRSFLSHRTATGVHGVTGQNTYEIHVTVPGRGAKPKLRNVVVHRTRRAPDPRDLRVRGGLRCSSVARALVEVSQSETRDELERIVEAAFRRRLTSDEMDKTLTRLRRGRRLANLEAVLAAYRPRPFDRSGLERSIARSIAADPEIPEPARNVHRHGWELDFLWEEERVVLEADGSDYHKLPMDIERDKLKDAKLAAAGLHVVRVTDARWGEDPAGVLADLRAILALRRRQPAA